LLLYRHTNLQLIWLWSIQESERYPKCIIVTTNVYMLYSVLSCCCTVS
jgi:hypothetical protein